MGSARAPLTELGARVGDTPSAGGVRTARSVPLAGRFPERQWLPRPLPNSVDHRVRGLPPRLDHAASVVSARQSG